jgi:hypothetical protein
MEIRTDPLRCYFIYLTKNVYVQEAEYPDEDGILDFTPAIPLLILRGQWNLYRSRSVGESCIFHS